jgi:hypothetical protein
MKFTLSGLDEALAEIDRRLDTLKQDVHLDLDWFGRTTSNEMVATHTFQNRTFRLETSIGYKAFFWNPSTGWRVEVEASAWYASQVELGHPGPPPARPYPFFWPVWYRYYPDALMEKLQATVTTALGGV